MARSLQIADRPPLSLVLTHAQKLCAAFAATGLLPQGSEQATLRVNVIKEVYTMLRDRYAATGLSRGRYTLPTGVQWKRWDIMFHVV